MSEKYIHFKEWIDIFQFILIIGKFINFKARLFMNE